MKKFFSILLAFFILSLMVWGLYSFLDKRKKADLPIASSTEQETIGGQRDVHGCLIPAGYSWCEIKQKCLRTWEESCSLEAELENYLQANLERLSPQKAVLGGKFYVTKLTMISSSTAQVNYEDGHIALKAQFDFFYQNSQITINNFNLLTEKPSQPATSKTPPESKEPATSTASSQQAIQIKFQPMQCQEEPWQKWYGEGKAKFFKIPTDEELIKAYYGVEYSLEVLNASRQPSSDLTCQACDSCPKDYFFTAKVDQRNLDRFVSLGWQKD